MKTREQLEELLVQLTMQEKLDMIHGSELFSTKGVERLGIPPFVTSDGPRGVRKDFHKDKWIEVGLSYDYSSYLPCNSALAATWNRKLAYETGYVLGKEARGRGKDMILAPGINIMRTPLCGRSFEYMGEDPYLAGEIAVEVVKGIEENDVASCVKHFALNNQETRRMDVDVEVSERALREIYLPGFESAVKRAKAKRIMGAYNKFRGTHCCHHGYLLNDILRGEWGFDGIVVSDWGGVHSTQEAVMNGLDMEMSVTDDFDEYYMANPLKEALEQGKLPMEKVDEKVRHILHVMNELHMFDDDRKTGSYNDYQDKEMLRKTAEESVVLLKNENGLLPLNAKKLKKVLVVGENANRLHSPGGGSAEIKALYEITPLLGINMMLGGNVKVTYMPGYYNKDIGNIWASTESEENGQADSLEQDASQSPDVKEKSKEQKVLQEKMNGIYLAEALEAARDADAVIYVGGLTHDYDTEGRDRESMKLPYDQDNLISELLKVRPDTIVTLLAGSPVDMTAWIDKAQAVVFSWYAGLEGGYALAEVLFGQINPSGRLPETFPIKDSDCPAVQLGEFPGDDKVLYGEDIFVGYRYYDTYQVKTAFPFGYGLSYTDFAFSGLTAKVIIDTQQEKKVEVSFDVSNVGDRFGAEVAQIYVSDKYPKLKKATKELKAFEKVFLQPGETKHITLMLDESAFTYYDEKKKSFCVESSTYSILLAKSAEQVVDVADIIFHESV